MRTPIFFKQAAFTHVDSSVESHLRIGKFDRAITFGVFQLFIAVSTDPIEFQYPVVEIWIGRNLTIRDNIILIK